MTGPSKDFTELTKDRKFAKGVDLEKINYWRGMSDLRLQNFDQARTVFTQLASLKRLGYYTGAAVARLNSLPASSPAPLAAPIPAVPLLTMQPKPSPSRTPSPMTSPSAGQPPVMSPTGTPEKSTMLMSLFERRPASDVAGEIPGGSSHNNEESLVPQKEIDRLDEEKSEEEESPEALADAPPITSLKNAALVERFERARDLIDLGFSNWARSELHEIERRTTNRSYLQTLMTEYHKAGDFFRSATIADNCFRISLTGKGRSRRAHLSSGNMLFPKLT